MKYSYTGPVVENGKVICEKWSGETIAPSKAKALSNLKWRFKKETNRGGNWKIEFPGKLNEVM